MACFIAPMVQAIATTVICKRKAAKIAGSNTSLWLQHLPDLEKMLWGGTLMLVVDHILNGELTWRFPFFTALQEENGASAMLREILSVGLPMCAALTLAWALFVALKIRRRAVAK